MRRGVERGAVVWLVVAFGMTAACAGSAAERTRASRVATADTSTTLPFVGATAGTDGEWVGAWAAAPSDAGGSFRDQTLRLRLTPQRDGSTARFRFSNRFGTSEVRFGSASVGVAGDAAAVVAGTLHPITFDGAAGVSVAPGADVVSDPVDIRVRSDETLAVSVHVVGESGPATRHAQAKQRSYAAPPGSGDRTADESGEAFGSVIVEEVLGSVSRPFVTDVEVLGDPAAAVVAAVGDSLTDGDQRTASGAERDVDVDARFPDALARLVRAERPLLSVLNVGIGGNRLLGPSTMPIGGPAVLARLADDVERRDDLSDVIVLVGINDLGGRPALRADELVDGLRTLVERLHRPRERCPSGLHVLVGTLPPTGGALLSDYANVGPRRVAVNESLRAGGVGDAVVDFDAVLRDPQRPDRLAAAHDSGDGLHPSSAGYARMAAAVDPAQLRGVRCGALIEG